MPLTETAIAAIVGAVTTVAATAVTTGATLIKSGKVKAGERLYNLTVIYGIYNK